jgi:hypothetical protein
MSEHGPYCVSLFVTLEKTVKNRFLALATGSTASAIMLASGLAVAQPAPTSDSTSPPAVSTTNADSKTMAAPVAGKNSFTEQQARTRLMKHGYKHVTALKLDDQSVWRGQATKDGVVTNVAVDYQGNITAQ